MKFRFIHQGSVPFITVQWLHRNLESSVDYNSEFETNLYEFRIFPQSSSQAREFHRISPNQEYHRNVQRVQILRTFKSLGLFSSPTLQVLSVLKGVFLSKIQRASNYNNSFNVIGFLEQRKQSETFYTTGKIT